MDIIYYIIWDRIEKKGVNENYIDQWQGESFYNPYIAKVIEELNSKGLIEESEGARVIFLEGFNIPLMVVKSDGGFNYASTDLTALWWVIFSSIKFVYISYIMTYCVCIYWSVWLDLNLPIVQ